MPRPLVMGVVNVTPDSFSDGGRYSNTNDAIAHARDLIAQGADILDIGGESTRPGAKPVSQAEELERVIPVIEALAGDNVLISIDTMKPEVARAAVFAGAGIWNDVSALAAPGAIATAAELNCQIVLMHMRGDPQTMQDRPDYANVVDEVLDALLAHAKAAMTGGVRHEAIWLDPGIGFGKTLDHNLSLLAHLGRFVGTGFPVLLGASRKRFINAIDQDAEVADERLGGSIAAALAGAAAGVRAVRVHDVRQTVQALKVAEAIDGAR